MHVPCMVTSKSRIYIRMGLSRIHIRIGLVTGMTESCHIFTADSRKAENLETISKTFQLAEFCPWDS